MLTLSLGTPSEAQNVRDGRAGELLHLFQDRHLPMTPGLAGHLARFEQLERPATDDFWGRAYDLAGEAVGQTRAFGMSRGWSTLFGTFCHLVVEPVLRAAARQMGEVYLLTTDELDGKRRKSAQRSYQDYCRDFEAHVDRLLTDSDKMPPGFWSHAGTSLAAAFFARIDDEGRSEKLREVRSLPARTDPLISRAVFDIEPEFSDGGKLLKKKLRALQKAQRERSGFRPREGGVEGVVYSRRFEDIHDALPSTFMYPRQLMPLKIMEDGFPITHRPPNRLPRRDLLWQSFNTSQIERGPAGIVKAAWLDAILRLRLLLAGTGQTRSEVGWCDVSEDELLPASASLSRSERTVVSDPFAVEGDRRRKMTSRSQLFPECAAMHPSRLVSSLIQRLKGADSDMDGLAARVLFEHVRIAATQAQSRTGRRPGAAKLTSERRVEIEDYALVVVMLVEDHGPSEDITDVSGWYLQERQIIKRFPMPQANRVEPISVRVPSRLEGETDGIVIASARNTQSKPILLTTDDDGAPQLGKLIGEVSLALVNEVVEALYDA